MIKKMNETWKDIKGFEGFYQVSNLGRIKSITRKIINSGCFTGACLITGRILKQGIDTSGYNFVNLCKDKKQRSLMVHKLVAIAFIPNPLNKPQINHLDYNPQNNNVGNLEWVTAKENGQHSVINHKKKIKHRNAKGQFV